MEPVRRLEYPYRVRFDEADADGRLRPSGLLRYAQDMAWRHSEEAGFGREWYAERRMNWLVRNVQVAIQAPATYGDTLAVSTEVIGWRAMWVRRSTAIRRMASSVCGASSRDGADSNADQLVATVQTDWVLLTSEGKPARVPRDIAHYFAAPGSFGRERVFLPEPTGDVTTLSTRVRPLDVDPMRHMNNAAYLDMVDDGLAHMTVGARLESPDCYRVGYIRPALPGTPIVIRCWTAGEREVACRISDAAGDELTKVLVRKADPST